jgi:cell division protein ZapA
MAEVTFTLNNRSYRLRCGDGEETRLREIVSHFEAKVADVRRDFGPIGDERLLVMAALLVTDELFDLRDGDPTGRKPARRSKPGGKPAVTTPPAEPASEPATPATAAEATSAETVDGN